LRTFGEIGIVSNQRNKKIRAKLEDHGFPYLFIGYPDNHAGECYRMFNLETKKVILSRNVLWLDKNYAEYKGITKVNKIQIVQALSLTLKRKMSQNPRLTLGRNPRLRRNPRRSKSKIKSKLKPNQLLRFQGNSRTWILSTIQ